MGGAFDNNKINNNNNNVFHFANTFVTAVCGSPHHRWTNWVILSIWFWQPPCDTLDGTQGQVTLQFGSQTRAVVHNDDGLVTNITTTKFRASSSKRGHLEAF